MTFKELHLINNIQQALVELGYETPTPIQELAIPEVLKGQDIVACAQTGTGKTGAFAIPIINYIHKIVGGAKKTKKIRTLVVTPTRELAIQIAESFDAYGKYTNIKTMVVYGGVSQNSQVEQLKSGVDVLVATPGRLLDLHKQGFIDLDHIHFLVLDEADLMLDMGFINDVKKIIKLTPDNRQTLLFSATMPLIIRELADNILTKPKYISITPISSAADNVVQKVYFVDKGDKRKLLQHLILTESLKNVLVFTRTKHGADNVVEALLKQGIEAAAIHGDKSQNIRQNVLESFKNHEISVLVATDVAARGIDIENLPYVINFDLPNIPETYVHRIGRTGRAGNAGIAISFCAKDEIVYLRDIEKLVRNKIKGVKDQPFPLNEGKVNENAKPDLRNKKTNNNSRKSEVSKKNKKRWY
jgi:ATP-dependent RNA helicase RhlE